MNLVEKFCAGSFDCHLKISRAYRNELSLKDLIVKRIAYTILFSFSALLTTICIAILALHTVTKITDCAAFKNVLKVNSLVALILVTSTIALGFNVLSPRFVYHYCNAPHVLENLFKVMNPDFPGLTAPAAPPQAPANNRGNGNNRANQAPAQGPARNVARRANVDVDARLALEMQMKENGLYRFSQVNIGENQSAQRRIQPASIEADAKLAREIEAKENPYGPLVNALAASPVFMGRLEQHIKQRVDGVLNGDVIGENASYEQLSKLSADKVNPPTYVEIDTAIARHFTTAIAFLIQRHVEEQKEKSSVKTATFNEKQVISDYKLELMVNHYTTMANVAICHFLNIRFDASAKEKDAKETSATGKSVASSNPAKDTAAQRMKAPPEPPKHELFEKMKECRSGLMKQPYFQFNKDIIHSLLLLRCFQENTDDLEKALKRQMDDDAYDDFYRRVISNPVVVPQKCQNLVAQKYYAKQSEKIEIMLSQLLLPSEQRTQGVFEKLQKELQSDMAPADFEDMNKRVQEIVKRSQGYHGQALFELIGTLGELVVRHVITLKNSQSANVINTALA